MMGPMHYFLFSQTNPQRLCVKFTELTVSLYVLRERGRGGGAKKLVQTCQ